MRRKKNRRKIGRENEEEATSAEEEKKKDLLPYTLQEKNGNPPIHISSHTKLQLKCESQEVYEKAINFVKIYEEVHIKYEMAPNHKPYVLLCTIKKYAPTLDSSERSHSVKQLTLNTVS